MSARTNRRAALRDAARWAMREDEAVLREPPPKAAADVQAMLDDPALADAMRQLPRISDSELHALRADRRRAIGAGGALALVAALGIGSWQGGWYRPAAPTPLHYETARGQQLEIDLADGSRLHLNGETSLDVTLDAESRSVAMRRGEAYFDVAHRPDQPFTVHAGGSATRVLGTAFDIDMASGGVRIAVYRGKVRFGGDGVDDEAVTVEAGWRTRFADGQARAPTRFDAAQQDWRQGWLDTDNMQLGELINALNRRGGRLVAPPPKALASVAVSGRFRLDSPQQLLDAMGVAYGFHVVRKGDALHLVPDAADTRPVSDTALQQKSLSGS
ncbi:FecR family protein [Sphingomonas sp. DT-207]|uniref:FecR family protein n=1 Tax=Sphingomonas sp. DT-207 TaxID=3396167 RepID=UPI003F1AA3E8